MANPGHVGTRFWAESPWLTCDSSLDRPLVSEPSKLSLTSCQERSCAKQSSRYSPPHQPPLQALLDARTRAIRFGAYGAGWPRFLASGWLERYDELYALCAEVAARSRK
jgi:hypothetical protein